MNTIAGLTTTGRRMHGPASDLVELVNGDGLRHTAIVFHPEYRDHPAINAALTVVLGFLESPMVTGLVELKAHDRAEGAFVYPTGQCSSVAEVNRAYADLGEVPGVRAGLELLYVAGEILTEAADIGESHGVYSHGGLTPWRILLKPDGQALVIGHALPQVEILQFREEARAVPREDSFRYCPPERLEGRAENLSSDHLSLALIAFELMTGKPVYDGLVNDIRAQASRGEGSRRLFRFRDSLPRSVQELLKVCFRPEMDGRHPSGARFLDEVRACLSNPEVEGPSLLDVMTRVARVQQRIGQPLDSGATMTFQKERLAEALGGEPGAASSAREAWSPPARPARPPPRVTVEVPTEEVAPPPASAPAAPPAAATPADLLTSSDAGRWRRPTRSPPSGEPPPPEDAPAAEPVGPARPGIGVARRPPRLAGRSATEVPPGPPPAGPPTPPPPPPPPPTVRGGASWSRIPPAEAVPPPAPPPEEPPTAPAEPVALTPSLPEAEAEPPPPSEPAAPARAPLGSLAPPAREPAREVDESEDGTGLLARPARTPPPHGPRPAWRTPDLPADEAPRGDTALFRVSLSPGAAEARLPLVLHAPSSEVVAELVGRRLPLRADPTGRLLGWWRFSVDGEVVRGTRAMADLPQDRTLEVVFVENRVEVVDLEVVAPSGHVHLRLAAGTAVPVATLVDAVTHLLDLPPGAWRLEAGTHTCQPQEILADHDPIPRLVLEADTR